ncbi:MAG: PocR ligand-binding domain-containing protein [Clostridia bacterium]|nr:PocR ligand-binding domain-containing protein [Clostridia bacterium]
MNKPEITMILAELHKITGFKITMYNADFEQISAYPAEAHPFCRLVNKNEKEHKSCRDCDKLACTAALESRDTYIYKCRYGLTEAVSPLYNFGVLSGFLMMGQIAESESGTLDAVRLAGTVLRGEDPQRIAATIPVVKPDMVSSFIKIMTVCAQYITLSNALPSKKPTVAEMAKKYIGENLGHKLSIGEICHSIGCSKSTLLTAFKKRYGVTINDYITAERLKQARTMLRSTEKKINEIAMDTGFSDQSYFSKVFTAEHGVSPSEYRYEINGGEEDR